MPQYGWSNESQQPAAEAAAAAPSTSDYGWSNAAQPAAAASGSKMPLVVGGAVAGGLALAAHQNPAAAARILKGLNTLRQQLMLSGFALPKSLLGNAGAALEASLEGGSLAPLKAMFSGETLKDAASAWKTGAAGGAAQVGQAPMGGNAVTKVLSKFSPGRAMGAFDEAAQKALVRGGLTPEAAQTVALQDPLNPEIADALDSPLARYLHPFRRQPFNQFFEGLRRFKPENIRQNPGTMAAYTGAGAIHGAATSDEKTPLSIPLAVAGSARYGVPYALAALVGRTAMGKSLAGSGIADTIPPVSTWGYESGVANPLRPIQKPAAFTALEKLLGP